MLDRTCRWRRCFWACFLMSWQLVCFVRLCSAQEGQSTEIGSRVHEFTSGEAARYAVTIDGTDEPLIRAPKPVLTWSRALGKRTLGDTYVWTHQGCARAIVSIYSIVDRRMVSAECQSLSEQPLSMDRDGDEIWSTRIAGVKFRKLPGVPAPSQKAFARMVQMNGIARKFRADYSPHTAPETFNNLRLLAKPLYRYQSKNASVIDGAVYGFVESTDPEILVVVEARVVDGERFWFYSPARSRHDHLRLYFEEKIVWEVPRLAPPWQNIRDPSKPYFSFRLEGIVEPNELEKIFD